MASALFGFGANAAETTTQGLGVSPAKITHELGAGQQQEDAFYILRRSEDPIELRLRVKSSTESLKGMSDALSQRSAASWVSLSSPSLVTVPAQSSVDIPYIVEAPSNAQGGEYFAFVEILDEDTLEVYDTFPITVRISDGAFTAGLVRFSSAERSLYLTSSVDMITGFENTGNESVVPSGSMKIVQGSRLIGEAEFNPEEHTVYPGVYQQFRHNWRPDVALGAYTLITDVIVSPDRAPIHVETSFWVFPWWLMVVILLVAAFVVILLYLALRAVLWNRIVNKEVVFMQIVIASAVNLDKQERS